MVAERAAREDGLGIQQRFRGHVAVLGTGVDPAQADLAGSVITGPDYTASGRTAGGPFWGANGTAIASLIAGHGHGAQNADGIIGVAPAAKILSVRVTLEGNDPLLTNQAIAAGLPDAIAKGIRYAVSRGASVIDLPLDPAALASATTGATTTGGATPGGSTPSGSTPGGSTAERDAVAYALSKNVVLVAPGGDEGAGADPVNYPAAYPGVISVGAFDQGFNKATFTSHQPYVTLTAAGDGVEVATPAGYTMIHSTSAASAVVAGIVALIRAQFPTLTPAQVTSALTTSTVFRPRHGRLDGSGYGTADAQAALVAAARINAAVPANPGSEGAVAVPTPPAVRAQGESGWATLRSVALLVAAVLLLLLFAVVIFLRARRRRSRAARLAPLREAGRVAVRAQPEFSAAPPPAGAPFAGAQFAGSPSGGSQFAGAQFQGAPFQGAQFAQSSFPGGRAAPAPFPGDRTTPASSPAGRAAQAARLRRRGHAGTRPRRRGHTGTLPRRPSRTRTLPRRPSRTRTLPRRPRPDPRTLPRGPARTRTLPRRRRHTGTLPRRRARTGTLLPRRPAGGDPDPRQ